MQLSGLFVVLIAAVLPAFGNASECNEKTAVPFPENGRAYFDKVDEAFAQMNHELIGTKNSHETLKLRKRQVQEEPFWPSKECKGNEICTTVLRVPICYDEKTTNMRMGDSMIITLKTGDVVYSNNIKGNVFTNQEPIIEQISLALEKTTDYFPEEFREIRKSKLAEASARRSSKAAATAGTAAATPAISSSTTAAPTVPSDNDSSATDSSSQPSSSENADSMAAGRMVVCGGWYAAAVAVLGGAALL